MRDLHRDLFVLAQQHGRIVAAVVDQRIVQAAITRPRIERDIRKSELFDQIDDDVRLPTPFGVSALRVGFAVSYLCIRCDFVHVCLFTTQSVSSTWWQPTPLSTPPKMRRQPKQRASS